jgi:hypothetical protein
MGLAVLLTRATYSTVVQKRENKDNVREQNSRNKGHQYNGKNKQELRDKENKTLEKFEEN